MLTTRIPHPSLVDFACQSAPPREPAPTGRRAHRPSRTVCRHWRKGRQRQHLPRNDAPLLNPTTKTSQFGKSIEPPTSSDAPSLGSAIPSLQLRGRRELWSSQATLADPRTIRRYRRVPRCDDDQPEVRARSLSTWSSTPSARSPANLWSAFVQHSHHRFPYATPRASNALLGHDSVQLAWVVRYATDLGVAAFRTSPPTSSERRCVASPRFQSLQTSPPSRRRRCRRIFDAISYQSGVRPTILTTQSFQHEHGPRATLLGLCLPRCFVSSHYM
ncbi:uncharacterized protein C8Q71DRAFT_140721 [Rhodofomes roseus]|uniref:Uncharacterized protein n=1 Tax=Rhodofomes roseus TaxID=34475 RepID=A0ABQ8KA92_9APHY|nr:uncharacterized protein C8Q71DRAFT_140721 [Rhodofomes roseus]KAH9834427.1 hypothetical protein C8Q71DRAFT_140721 [Rhodofomes roseus]